MGISLQHVKLQPNSLKNYLLEIALNIQKCTQLKLASITSMGKGVSGNFTKKLFWWKMHEMSRCAHKTSFLPTIPLIRVKLVQKLPTCVEEEKHKFYIPMNSHHEFFFMNWSLNPLPSHHGLGSKTWAVCISGHFM